MIGCFYFQADTEAADIQEALEKKKKRTFRKYTYRGVDLDQLLDMSKYVLSVLLQCRCIIRVQLEVVMLGM